MRNANRLALVASVFIAVVFATACSVQPKIVDHAFSFDAFRDSPDVEVLDYRYGAAGLPGTRKPDWANKNQASGGTNINGSFPLGDTLHVKWRVKATGEVLEDSVDLRPLLPQDMIRHRIHFIVRNRQLAVYVITPEARPPNWPVIGPTKYAYFKALQIYPRP
jgi:hypothetical protein